MTDLTQLRAERDAARGSVDRVVWALHREHRPEFRADLDALLRAERRLALAEACEALEQADLDFGPGSKGQIGVDRSAAFLRARLTEETGR